MFQITNHNEQALATSIPYLLKFPEIYKLLQQSGDRAQVIEDIAWQLLYNLDYNSATGVWLDYIGKKVGQSRLYTKKPENAFTFGGSRAEGFGAGKFISASSIFGSKVARSDYSFRNAIKAKILANSTDASLDELISAIKLLYNAKVVTIKESYPAGIERIDIYGSNILEDLDVVATLKAITTIGVSLGYINYHVLSNLFRNNAFITYNSAIPANDDFELSFIVNPANLSETENTALLSQGANWMDEFAPVRLYYDVENDEGVVFRTAPNIYNDNNTNLTSYNDEEDENYYDSRSGVYLSGGTLLINDENTIRVTKTGNVWSLYVNNVMVDTLISDYLLSTPVNTRLFLGASNNKYYNSGAIYNLLLENKTTDTIIINDILKTGTVGINNGVIWI